MTNEKQPVNLSIDIELYKRWKIRATHMGTTMTEVMVRALTRYLDELQEKNWSDDENKA